MLLDQGHLGGRYGHDGWIGLVTEDGALLGARQVLARHNGPVLLTPSEALDVVRSEMIGSGVFRLGPIVSTDVTSWHIDCAHAVLPRRRPIYDQSVDPRLGGLRTDHWHAFFSQQQRVLQSVENVGLQYYRGADGSTMSAVVYHLEYFVILACTMLDYLAVSAALAKGAIPNGTDFVRGTGLTAVTFRAPPSRGARGFRKLLKQRSRLLSDLLDEHEAFLRLLFELRDIAVHRHGLSAVSCSMDRAPHGVDVLGVRFASSAQDHITSMDSPVVGQELSVWGRGLPGGNVEPYRFVRCAASRLFELADQVLAETGTLIHPDERTLRVAERTPLLPVERRHSRSSEGTARRSG